MAYETGSYATLEQLVTALKIFSEANGWTTDEFSDFRGGKRLSHHNADGIYLHWYSANNVQINAYFRDTNGSYGGDYVTRLVMHPGTGYDPSKHPAWQPGVAGIPSSSVDYYLESARQIFNTCQIPVYGIYHFVAAPGLLAVLLDAGDAFFRHIVVDRVAKLPGGDVDYVVHAQRSAASLTDDVRGACVLYANNTSSSNFNSDDFSGILASGAWSKNVDNADGQYVAQAMSPYVSTSSGKDLGVLLYYTQPSGVNGVAPLYPALFFKRVSGVLRPVGYLEHICHVNISAFVNGQEIQTTSGAWRVFNTGNPVCGFAVRSDL